MTRTNRPPPGRGDGPDGDWGVVVATRGRRVEVSDRQGGRRVCFLSGHRAVVGDEVRWVRAQGTGGKVVQVLPRRSQLVRGDRLGREQVLAANLGGLLVTVSPSHPPYRPGLVDRYLIAASVGNMRAALLLNKVDLGVEHTVDEDLAWREALGIPVFRVSAQRSEGLDALATFLAGQPDEAPWALVGHSGVGKTSVVERLLPDEDVGPVGEISEFWDQGRHTTTGSRIFRLRDGGRIVDSPGIRTFLPGGLTPTTVRDHFPGMGDLRCRYRDCLHRQGEDGCAADGEVAPRVLLRYRRVLDEVLAISDRVSPARRERR